MARIGRSVIVLGAGPAGLLAAHAARRRGYSNVMVASSPDPKDPTKVQKSELYGCQYLHRTIPGAGIPLLGEPVRYRYQGDPLAYRAKVYGDKWDGDTSVDEYGSGVDHLAWDLRLAYNRLWEEWEPFMVPLDLTPRMVGELKRARNTTIFSTVPAPALCLDMDNHRFVSQGVWAMGSFPGRQMPYIPANMTVECNGDEAPRWYRAATVFGYTTVEWPAGPKPPIRGVAAVSKPLNTDCACHLSERYHRLGRYGRWQKGVLTHTAYEMALEVLA